MEPHPGTTDDLLARDVWLRKLAVAVAADDLSAADLVQDTWVRTLRSPPIGVRDAGAWFSAVLHNVARNVRRGAARSDARERAVARRDIDPGDSPFDLAAYEERRADLVRTVESLPPKQRDTIVARYWEGLEPAEIARRNGEDAAAVRQRLKRALETLRARVDDEHGDRRAWLAPLVGAMPARDVALAAGAAGSIVWIGGLTMKKWMALGLSVLVVWFAASQWPAGAEPASTPVTNVDAQHPETTTLDTASPDGDVTEERVALPPSHRSPGGTQDAFVLRSADGRPMAGVAYWRDERPFRMHPGRAPDDAARTDELGRFDPEAEAAGEGAFVWFEIDAGLSIATEWTALERTGVIHCPHRRRISVEIRSLPSDAPRRMSIYPAWSRKNDTDLTHGSQHVHRQNSAHGLDVWIARRRVDHRSESGPARSEFEVVEGLPIAAYCYSEDYRVEPEIQELPEPRDVIAHASRARPLFRFEIVEADGATPHDTHGRALFASDREGWSTGRMFRNGRGQVDFDMKQRADDVRMAIVLPDGELWDLDLDDARIGPDRVLHLRRGTGRPARLSMPWPEEFASWTAPDITIEVDGRFRSTSALEYFTPDTEDTSEQPGAWIHDGMLVAQASNPSSVFGRVRVMSEDGRVAHSDGDRFVISPHIEMQAVRPREMLDSLAEPAKAKYLMLAYDVAWNDAKWNRVRTMRFHRVDGFGWRYSPDASIDWHQALPDSIALCAPSDARTRLRGYLRVNGKNQWVDVPHGPAR